METTLIAAQKKQAHCSSLLVTSTGAQLIAWFEGEHEGARDARIRIARQTAAMAEAETCFPFDDTDSCHWNPVLAEHDSRIWLFFKRGFRIDEWVTYVSHSSDDGRTWTTPTVLLAGRQAGGRGPVRHRPHEYGGLWVAPGSVEVWQPKPRWDVFVDLFDGNTWHQVRVGLDHTSFRGAGCIQPALWQTSQGQLAMLCRSTAGRAFYSATSDPYNWPQLTATHLPNNNSGLAVTKLPSGQLVCIHNDCSENWGARNRLVASVSNDDARTWDVARFVIEDEHFASANGTLGGDGAPTGAAATGVQTSGDAEYSYPSSELVGSELLVAYTWKRRGIALASIGLEEFS